MCFCGDYSKMIDEIKDVRFDIIFIDPPYNKGLGIKAIERISSYNLLKIDGILVYETDEVENVPDAIGMYERFNYKKYGRNVLNFYKRKE
ncbi:MAG: RsmD family RNA methyltransferase [Clostridia bacterium]|nr:RsmD family RNA methyltransferase [Clostridia bacterium]